MSPIIATVFTVAAFLASAMGQAGCGCNSGITLANLGLSGNGLGNNLALGNNGVSGCSSAYVGSGGGLGVTTYSPIAPAGVTIVSNNDINGPLDICGGLPVLSAAALEGQLPTTGLTGVQYCCGNGVGITALDNAAGLAGGAGLAAPGAGLGYGAGIGLNSGYSRGLGGCGCSCA